MRLKTRVFELFQGRYKSLRELAQAIGISLSQLYRIRDGTRQINHEFIVGATKAFPGYTLDDLFYITSAYRATRSGKHRLSVARVPNRKDMLTPGQVADLLGIHANRVRRWADKGIQRAYRLGPRGDRMFWQSDVDTFYTERKPVTYRRRSGPAA